MSTKAWLWRFGEYDSLMEMFARTIGYKLGVVLRSPTAAAIDDAPKEIISSSRKISDNYIFFSTKNKGHVKYALGLDECDLEVIFISESVDIQQVSLFVRNYAWSDSRGASFEGLLPEGKRVVSTWPYAVWVQCSLIDAPRTCLVVTSKENIGIEVEEFLRNNASFKKRTAGYPGKLALGEARLILESQ